MAPEPPKAIGKGLVTNGFIAMLFTGRYVAGRSQNSLITGPARHGAEVSPGTLSGTCATAGALPAPLEDAIAARSRARAQQKTCTPIPAHPTCGTSHPCITRYARSIRLRD